MITDEQIKQGLDKAYNEAGHNAYFGNGFEAGVKYAQEQFEILNIPCVNKWVECAERQPEESGMYLVENKYELTGEYHTCGKWAGKWTVDDNDGYEIEIYVTKWKAI